MEYPKDEDELKRWIADGIEESINLDYKGPASLAKTDKEKTELTKDVSAMANSAGGVLIYGVREFPANSGRKHLPEKIEAVDGHQFSKEWLEQTINSRVKPRIAGMRIVPIRLSGDAKGVVYVVVIPQSEIGHQADDRRYYRRFNFESVPMEDYEVRDLMGRSKHPQVRVNLSITEEVPSGLITGPKIRFLNVSVGNVGSKVAHHVRVFLYVPLEIMGPRSLPDYSMEDHHGMQVARFNLALTHVWNSEAHMPLKKNDEPLLPELEILLTKIRMSAPGQELKKGLKLGWRLYADDAPSRNEKISLDKVLDLAKQGTGTHERITVDLDINDGSVG